MRFFPQTLSLLLAVTVGASSLHGQDESIDLAGEWEFVLDPNDLGLTAGPATWNFPDTIQLPGTTAAQKKGEPLKLELNLEKPAMQHLHQRFPYIGPAWYQREVAVPADWEGKDVIFTLERVLWQSRVWIDQKPVAAPQNSLSVPHRYDLTKFLTPGKTHTLTLRIDNRSQVDIGTIGHAYSEETQTIWNGVIGELKLEALPKIRLSHLGISTYPTRSGFQLDLELLNQTDRTTTAMALVRLDSGNGAGFKTLGKHPLKLAPGKSQQAIMIDTLPEDLSSWSEFDPATFRLQVELGVGGAQTHSIIRELGLRTFVAKGRDILINDQKTFLRGNLECAIFPQTGHPDASGEQWEKIMRVSKAHGLNHLRFHSWCPPEAAFAAADKHGIYLQVELPNWTFKMGQRPVVDAFLKAEGERIIREFSHHPSFVLFSLGNELVGNLQSMDALIEHFRQLAPDLLFTSTSYAFSPRGRLPGPQDDFFISQRTESGWVRGQGFLNDTFPSTDTDYAQGLECLKIPLITHEVGQYVVYPNLAELPKYESTPMRATALEAIQADLEDKKLIADAARFTRDSGKLAALLYKEDIERALRTPDLAGIQLLQLQDFPGQSTATVGLLDAFWDSKGAITAEEFSQFCSPTVPLARLEKFVWPNDERFTAKLELAHFGEAPLKETSFTASLTDADGKTLASKTFDPADYPLGNALSIGAFDADLSGIEQATQLTLEVRDPQSSVRNSWPIWVYPATEPVTPEPTFTTHRGVTPECLSDLAAGKNVLLLPPAGAIRKAIPARFIPVFWSPLHFPNQPGTLGATIDTAHPLWKHFPTETHTNWQWWELTATSTAVDLTDLDPAISKPFRFIDKFNRNALPSAIFEARVGPGQLLVCTLDVESKPTQRIVARQLRRALEARIVSPSFKPTGSLTPEQLAELIGESTLVATADSAHPDFPATLAVDGDPNTFWHSDWRGGKALPFALSLDLLKKKVVTGFDYLPRQNQVNGRIKDYQIQISQDGESWVNLVEKARFTDSKQTQSVTLPNPVKTRYIRLVALSEQSGQAHASCAEWQPRFTAPGDVRELGIIPGFNDSSK